MDFPSFYGGNADALWDCLTGFIDLPITIEWEFFENTQKMLGPYANLILKTFQDAQNEAVWINCLTSDSVRNPRFFFIYYLFAPEPLFLSRPYGLNVYLTLRGLFSLLYKSYIINKKLNHADNCHPHISHIDS